MYILFATASGGHIPRGNINIDRKTNMSNKHMRRVHSTLAPFSLQSIHFLAFSQGYTVVAAGQLR